VGPAFIDASRRSELQIQLQVKFFKGDALSLGGVPNISRVTNWNANNFRSFSFNNKLANIRKKLMKFSLGKGGGGRGNERSQYTPKAS